MKNRKRFMYLQGFRYAGQGNKFSDYRDALEAFGSFCGFYQKPWAERLGLQILASDFVDFQRGYQALEIERHKIQVARAQADKELNIMLQQLTSS